MYLRRLIHVATIMELCCLLLYIVIASIDAFALALGHHQQADIQSILASSKGLVTLQRNSGKRDFDIPSFHRMGCKTHVQAPCTSVN